MAVNVFGKPAIKNREDYQMTIADLIYKAPKKRKKIALDGSLELKDKLLISNIYSFNSSSKGRQLQR